VEIAMLGGFRVSVGGAEVPERAWAGRRAKELLQLLALAPARALMRDQVLEALWPHLEPAAGAANLRKAAHHARQALDDPQAVVLRGGVVRLFPERTVVTDVDGFVQAVARARAAGDPEAYSRAAATYGGELLPEALYDDWTTLDRARLRATYVEVLRAAGMWVEVVDVDPTDEEAYQHLMRQALATDARAGAIRWYGRLRSVLARELAVAPAEESERLYAACLDGLEPAARPYFGRDVEQATVTALLCQRGHTRASTIVVRGDAGIGKTAFCGEVASIAQRVGWTVITMDGGGLPEPYGPVRAAIDELLVAERDLVRALAPSARAVLSVLTPIAGDAPPLDGPLGRHQVIGGLRRLLLAASSGGPALVILDDAHTADDATLDALVHLTSSGAPITVVLALRPHPVNPTLDHAIARMLRAARLAVIDLGPLDRHEAAHLVHDVTGDEIAPEVLDQIVEAGAGNPFLTLELARSNISGNAGSLPRDVSAAITARLLDMGDKSLDLLKRIALASDDLDSTAVVALTGGTEEAAFSVLDAALEAGVLLVDAGRYRFRHDLMRQALVEQVPPHERLAVHRDAARRLTALGSSPAVIAHHWLEGGRPGDAVPFLLEAARHALGIGAYADALGFLEPLLAHEPAPAEARRLRAEALDVLGDVRAVSAYNDAIDVAPDSDVDDLRAKRALAQLKQGDPAGALRALDGVTPTSVDGRLAQALTFSGAAALGFADPATGTAMSAACRRAALESGDAAAIVVASWSQAAAAHARGELRDSVLADLRDTRNLPHLAVRVFDGQLCVTQRLLYGARPYEDVIAFADSLTAEAARLGAARGRAFGVTLRGEAELLSGRLDDAERDLNEGAQLHHGIHGATGEAHAMQRLAELALHQGQRVKAASLLDEAIDLAQSTDIGFHLLDRIYGTRVTLAHDPDDALHTVEEAEDAVRGVLETCPGCRITFAVPAAIAAARAGDLDRAAAYEQSAQFLAQLVMRLPAWHAALDEVRGHIARARGDRPTAGTHFAAAAARFREASHPLDAERCETELRAS